MRWLPISKTASGCKREPFRQGGIPFVFFVMLHFGYNGGDRPPPGRDYSERGLNCVSSTLPRLVLGESVGERSHGYRRQLNARELPTIPFEVKTDGSRVVAIVKPN